MSPDSADALHMAVAPPARLILGIDPGGRDWTALAICERMGFGTMRLLEMEIIDPVKMKTTLDRLIDKMNRSVARPSGYSRSHWRKIWKARR